MTFLYNLCFPQSPPFSQKGSDHRHAYQHELEQAVGLFGSLVHMIKALEN